MRIVQGRQIAAPGHAAAQARLDRAKAANFAAVKDLAAKRQAAGVKPGVGRVGGVHQEAVMAAIQQEGPEVMTSAAKGWWDDQLRLNPWMAADGVVPDGNSANGHYGRHGKVMERMIRGQWYHWQRGRWVKGEISKRKGVR